MKEVIGAKLKEFRVLLVCIVIVVVIFISNAIVSNVVYSKNLAKADDQMQQLTGEVEKLRVTKQQAVSSTKAKVTGLDTKRVKTDDGIMEAFLKKCFTWSSAEEYRQIRSDLQNSSDLNASGTFVDVLFPELLDEVTVDGDGNTNVIDDSIYGKLNMKYDSLKSHVVAIDGTDYSYFTEVTVTSAIDGGISSTGSVILTYTVDKDGNLSELDAYTVAN